MITCIMLQDNVDKSHMKKIKEGMSGESYNVHKWNKVSRYILTTFDAVKSMCKKSYKRKLECLFVILVLFVTFYKFLSPTHFFSFEID